MKKIFKILMVSLFLVSMITVSVPSAFAKGQTGKVTPKTVGAGALSLLVWPGIGQAVNSNTGDKVLTHAILGLIPVYRVWSCYDAVVDRQGGYWDGRI